GLQSDSRYAEAFVRSRAARVGSSRLRSELSRRGIDRELIDEAIAGECVESELDRARAVLHSRFSAAPADAREWARQARFLQARGFAPELIRKLLKEPHDESA
ncbi:MAG: RecX family transcriptional regulator, partial [Thauera sp.]|nr:RecX family transcriptional regulator [Thauera sp.]